MHNWIVLKTILKFALKFALKLTLKFTLKQLVELFYGKIYIKSAPGAVLM